MTRKQRIIALAILGAVLALQWMTGVFLAGRPGAWDQVAAGMSQDQVYGLVGEPDFSTLDLKGMETWRRISVLNERKLIVHYDSSRKVKRVDQSVYWRWTPD